MFLAYLVATPSSTLLTGITTMHDPFTIRRSP
jgi:hypothetical protein